MGHQGSKFSFPGYHRGLLIGLATCLLAPVVCAAAEEQPPPFSDKTSEAFTKLPAVVEAKDWDGALALINGALAIAGPDSYDRAYLMDTLAKLEFQKDDIAKAIGDWEVALQLADAHPNYFKPKERLDLILFVAQTSSQLAQNDQGSGRRPGRFCEGGELHPPLAGDDAQADLRGREFLRPGALQPGDRQ